jgi:hypothetical protein
VGRRFFLHALQRLHSSLSALRLAFEREKKHNRMHWFFIGEISSNFDLKNMISTYIKDFLEQFAKIAQISEENIPNCQIFCDKFPLVAKNIEGFCFFSTFISRP